MARLTLEQVRQKAAELGRPLVLADVTSTKTTWARVLADGVLAEAKAAGLIAGQAGRRPARNEKAGVVTRSDLAMVHKLASVLPREQAILAVSVLADCPSQEAEGLLAEAERWALRQQAEQKLRQDAEGLLAQLRELMAQADVTELKVTSDDVVILRYAE